MTETTTQLPPGEEQPLNGDAKSHGNNGAEQIDIKVGGNNGKPEQAQALEMPQTIETEQPKLLEVTHNITRELHQREEKRLDERYGRGFMGNLRWWCDNTKIGRAVNIGGKVVLGTTAAVTAGMLSGGIGLVAAPALYALGTERAINGAIEAVQYFAKGRGKRLQLEGAKQDLMLQAQEVGTLETRLQKGEINVVQFTDQLAEMTKAIYEAEQKVIQMENDNISWEKKQKMIRGIASVVSTIGIGIFTGIPLGVQNFDGDKVSHAVRLTTKGLTYMKDIGASLAASLGIGAKGALVAKGFTAAAPFLGAVKTGIGAALVGLVSKVGSELRSARQRNEVQSESPKYIQVSEQIKDSAEFKVADKELQRTEQIKAIDDKIKALEAEYDQLMLKDMATITDKDRLIEISEEIIALEEQKSEIDREISEVAEENADKVEELNAITLEMRQLEVEYGKLDALENKDDKVRQRMYEIQVRYHQLVAIKEGGNGHASQDNASANPATDSQPSELQADNTVTNVEPGSNGHDKEQKETGESLVPGDMVHAKDPNTGEMLIDWTFWGLSQSDPSKANIYKYENGTRRELLVDLSSVKKTENLGYQTNLDSEESDATGEKRQPERKQEMTNGREPFKPGEIITAKDPATGEISDGWQFVGIRPSEPHSAVIRKYSPEKQLIQRTVLIEELIRLNSGK